MQYKFAFAFLLILVLSGCATPAREPVDTANLVPTPPAVVHVSFSESSRWIAQFVPACEEALRNTVVLVDDLHDQPQEVDGTSLRFQWGGQEEETGNAYVFVEEEPLLLIGHGDLPLQRITREQLEMIYKGETQRWSDLVPDTSSDTEIVRWNYHPGIDARMIWENWLGLGNQKGEFLVPSVPAMLEEVAGTPGSIGYIPASWLSNAVTSLEVDGALLPGEPIIVLIEPSPDDELQNWLFCLQDAKNSP